MGRRHAEVFFDLLRGEGFAQPNPRPMFPNPPGLLRLEPYSDGLRDRIWWGVGSNATAIWAAKLGMNLQSSTLKNDETGEAFHVQQAARSGPEGPLMVQNGLGETLTSAICQQRKQPSHPFTYVCKKSGAKI